MASQALQRLLLLLRSVGILLLHWRSRLSHILSPVVWEKRHAIHVILDLQMAIGQRLVDLVSLLLLVRLHVVRELLVRLLLNELLVLLPICLVDVHQLVNQALLFLALSRGVIVVVIEVVRGALKLCITVCLLSQVGLAAAVRDVVAFFKLRDAPLILLEGGGQEDLVVGLR